MALQGGVSHNLRKKLIKYVQLKTKISNDTPSYRVGEAPRAHPKGLTRLPNIYNLERYQLQTIKLKKRGADYDGKEN